MKLKRKDERQGDYSRLITKTYLWGFGMLLAAVIIIALFYAIFWQNKGGDFVVSLLQNFFPMDYYDALYIYQTVFRNNITLIWLLAIAIVFFLLFYFFIRRFTRYFNEINGGIDALVKQDGKDIVLPPEMSATEKNLNTVRRTLEKRTLEAQLAEQKKNDLVMYLAHDIKTPLTSVIGYLSLLDEAPDMPSAQRVKYVHITLNKAYRLETLINEFFEITRYHQQQIRLEKEPIDLYYMLVQMIDEFYPILSENGNKAVLCADENLAVWGDAVKLARVFNNILKNAAAYSDPGTEIAIDAREQGDHVAVSFANRGITIPPEKLEALFEKFFRLDEARTSNTGGSGLGLSIAREIVSLHGGTIEAKSENRQTVFTVLLPKGDAVKN
ncbi:MAG TPA: HAMP domain-containing sensor histidine kinase [Clostridiales bacterium]|nr:HAMP domain-containing sensor histidine kinase [Clostridiales bacterium]